MRRETGVKTPTENPPSEPAWRHYPHIEAAIESDSPSLIVALENTWHEVQRMAQTGTQAERDRARAVATACGRALGLYRQLIEVRDRLLQVSGESRSKSA